MGFIRGFVRFVVGVIFGLISGMALIPAFAAFSGQEGNGAWPFFMVVTLGALLCLFAPTVRRAFGRGFLLASVSVFALPLSAILLSGRVANDMMTSSTNADATLLGAGLVGTMMTGVAGFIGFFLGSILLIIGLVLALGGRREVIVVSR